MLDIQFQPAPEEILEVSALTQQIKRLLEGSFRQVWVRGEVSNCRKQSAGHVYFSIKDAGSQLPSVLFARDAAQQDFEIEDGQEILLFGDLSVYKPHGRYQLVAKIALHSGQGQLQLEFERLKRKLASEGLFDKERKGTLPTLPRRIAVVTSPTGAALRDFLRILQRRHFKGEIIIFPVRVQGKEAAQEIESALEHADASSPEFDSIVLTRGGGSIEDLWPFNNESLARKITECKSHIISAVGHEIDQVLTDFTADLRAETPSAAAEILSSRSLETHERLLSACRNLVFECKRQQNEAQQRLKDANNRLRLMAPDRQIALLLLQVDDAHSRFESILNNKISSYKCKLQDLGIRLQKHHPRLRFQLAQQNLKAIRHRLEVANNNQIQKKNLTLLNFKKRLENTNLQTTLQRGFAIITNAEGKILPSAKSARDNTSVTARFHDGNIQLIKDRRQDK
jgi:exodeoxyribonuclease VII large subunit